MTTPTQRRSRVVCARTSLTHAPISNDAKLQRSLDRLVEIVGPASIIVISLIVGGLSVSVMTALLSVNQMVQ
jgi:type II secretory pathway component PulF